MRENRSEIVYFSKMGLRLRLVYCFNTHSHLLELKDANSAGWHEKYISRQLAAWIIDKYAAKPLAAHRYRVHIEGEGTQDEVLQLMKLAHEETKKLHASVRMELRLGKLVAAIVRVDN